MGSPGVRAGVGLAFVAAAFLSTRFSAAAEDPEARLAALRRAEHGSRPPSARAAAEELGEIGRLLLDSGRLGPAIEVLEETVGRNPEDQRSLARLVLAFTRRGDYEFARSYLDLASQRDPATASDSGVYAEIGDRFSEVNRLEAAVIAWDLFRRSGGLDRSVLSRLDRARRELSATPGQRSLASEHFTLFGDEAIQVADLRRIEEALTMEYERQAALFGADLESPQVVVLHAGRRYFSLVSIPDWVSGVFDGKIRVSLEAERPSGPQVDAVLSHELAHAFIRDLSAGRAPGWLHEGLAQWCSGRRIPRSDFRAELAGQPVRSLAEMAGSLASADSRTVRGHYAEALGIVEYLAHERGEAAIFCVVRGLGAGDDLAKALVRETGWTPEQLVSGWKAWAGL